MWVSISLSRGFNKKEERLIGRFNKREERLIGRKSFWVMWEGLPAFGLNITITSSHLDEMWFGARQPSSTLSAKGGV